MTKKNSKVVVGCCCWPLFSGCCCWPLFSRSKLYKFASFYLQCQRSENHHKPPTVTCVCVLKRVQPKEGLLDWVWRWDGDSVCVGEVLPEENMVWEEQNNGRSEMHHQVQPGLRV